MFPVRAARLGPATRACPQIGIRESGKACFLGSFLFGGLSVRRYGLRDDEFARIEHLLRVVPDMSDAIARWAIGFSSRR